MSRLPAPYTRAVARAIVRAVEDNRRRGGTFTLEWLYIDAPSVLRSPSRIGLAMRRSRRAIGILCALSGVRVVAYNGRRYGIRARPIQNHPRWAPGTAHIN